MQNLLDFDKYAIMDKSMKSFTDLLFESGGKRILGVNPLQMTRKGLQQVINQFGAHVELQYGNHGKIIDKKTGNVLMTFTNASKIGPRASIDVLSTLRNHLKSIGAIKEDNRESKGTNNRRQNTVVKDEEKKTAIPEKSTEELKQKEERLRAVVQERLGEKRKGRIRRALERVQQNLASKRK